MPSAAAKLVEHVVVRNGAVDQFIAFVLCRLSSFEVHRLHAP